MEKVMDRYFSKKGLKELKQIIKEDFFNNKSLKSKITLSMYIVYYTKISVEIIPDIEENKLSIELSSDEKEKIITSFIQLPITYTLLYNTDKMINKELAEEVKTGLLVFLNYKNSEAYNQLHELEESLNGSTIAHVIMPFKILTKIDDILKQLDPSLSSYHPKEYDLKLEKLDSTERMLESTIGKKIIISKEYVPELSKLVENTIETLFSCSEEERVQKIFELVGFSNFSFLQELIFAHNFIDGKF